MKTFTELIESLPRNATIQDTGRMILEDIEDGKKIMVSVSGGSDSDILVDLYELVGYEPGQVTYVFFNTGIEMEATVRHLEYLENKYGIRIERLKAKTPVPLAVRERGVPFLSIRRHWRHYRDVPKDLLERVRGERTEPVC